MGLYSIAVISGFFASTAADRPEISPAGHTELTYKHWPELGKAGCPPRLDRPVNRMFSIAGVDPNRREASRRAISLFRSSTPGHTGSNPTTWTRPTTRTSTSEGQIGRASCREKAEK